MRHLLSIILFIIQTNSIYAVCQPPDVPYGGSYVPVQKKYLPGDRISFSCKDKFTRIGRESRSCQGIGKWSGSTPFCDMPSKVKNPRATSDPLRGVSSMVDGNTNTCYRSINGTGQAVQVFLDEPNAVNVIRLYLPKGKKKLEINSINRGVQKSCASYDRDVEGSQWVQLECEDNRKGIESIRISDISPVANVIAICEIEVYTEDDVWCKTPPATFIPNGYLEVSRDKATLRCLEGYKEGENTRMVCEKNSTWSIPNLQCNEIFCDSAVGNGSSIGTEWKFEGKIKLPSVGTAKIIQCNLQDYSITGTPQRVICQKDGTWTPTNAKCKRKEKDDKNTLKIIGISVGAVVVFLMFACMGLTLYCIYKNRGKQVVVVYTPSDVTTTSLKTDSLEAEYSNVYYEAAPPFLPQTLPPRNVSPSYSKPIDAIVTPTPAKRRPADIAFGTLKNSTLYGT